MIKLKLISYLRLIIFFGLPLVLTCIKLEIILGKKILKRQIMDVDVDVGATSDRVPSSSMPTIAQASVQPILRQTKVQKFSPTFSTPVTIPLAIIIRVPHSLTKLHLS